MPGAAGDHEARRAARRAAVVLAALAATAGIASASWLLVGPPASPPGAARPSAVRGHGAVPGGAAAGGVQRQPTGDAGSDRQEARVAGAVVDRRGTPLPGVQVALHRFPSSSQATDLPWDAGEDATFIEAPDDSEAIAATLTDAAGRFELELDRPRGHCFVRARGEGMVPATEDASPVVRLTLLPVRVCLLRVVDQEGRSVPGARVQAQDGREVLADERTGPDGVVKIPTSADGTVVIGAPGLATVVIDEGACGFDPADRDREIVLGPQRSLSGRVLADGTPATGALVRVDRFRVKTDGEGRFAIEGLAPGVTPISAELEELRAWAEADLTRGSVEGLEVVLPSPPRLAVRVRDELGAPVQGARVRAEGGPSVGTRTTDVDGVAVLRLEPGVYGVEIAATHFAEELRELDLRGTRPGHTRELEVTVRPGYPLWVRFEHASGRAVRVGDAVLVPLGGLAPPVRLHTIDERAFAPGLPAGRFELRWEVPGVVPVSTGSRAVVIPGDRELVVRLPPAGSIRGIVLDTIGEPTPGVRVGAAALAATVHAEAQEARTGARGEFAIEGLGAGEWIVFVRDAGLISPHVRAHTGATDVVLHLTTERIEIEGTVVRADGAPLEATRVILRDRHGFPSRSWIAFGAGYFAFENLPRASYRLTAATEDLESATVETRGDAPVQLVLDRPASLDARLGTGPWRDAGTGNEMRPHVRVEVGHADGRPAQGCWIEWVQTPPSGLGAAPCRGSSVDLPLSGPGVLRVVARGPGGAASAPLELVVGERLPPPVRLVLGPPPRDAER